MVVDMAMRLRVKSRFDPFTDVSPNGCRLYCHSSVPIEENEPVEISLKLKNRPDHLKLNAHIIRVNPFKYIPYSGTGKEINFELGVKFIKVNESQKEAIENFTGMVLKRMKKG